jgi:hypothetical protein
MRLRAEDAERAHETTDAKLEDETPQKHGHSRSRSRAPILYPRDREVH